MGGVTMSPALRVVFWLFGSLLWAFWMYLAYQSDFLGMLSEGMTKTHIFLDTFLPGYRSRKRHKTRKRYSQALLYLALSSLRSFVSLPKCDHEEDRTLDGEYIVCTY